MTSANIWAPAQLRVTQLLELHHRADCIRAGVALVLKLSGTREALAQRQEQVAVGRDCLRFVAAVRPLWNSSNSLCAAVSFLQLLPYWSGI